LRTMKHLEGAWERAHVRLDFRQYKHI
jgi:hypothetical protein